MRRALMIGINNYRDNANCLSGCANDARRMFQVLSSHEDGSQNFECMLLTNPQSDIKQSKDYDQDYMKLKEKITATLVKQHLHELFTEKADVVLFYFSGHGTINNLGGYLVTWDHETFNPGVSMPELITLANNAVADEVVIIIDCCHSGTFGGIPVLGNENAILREGVSILTASAANQPALEQDGNGVFTNVVYESLNGVASDFLGRVTVASLYTYVEQTFGAWSQRPLYKSNVRQMVTLRKSSPPLSFEILRKIPQYFPSPDYVYPLDPSFEPTYKGHVLDNTKVFSHFQKMRDARLIQPIDAEHLYYAAMNNKSCKLTPLGKYYWRLAKLKKFGIDVSK